LKAAADAFAWGRFEESMAKSRAAEAAVAGASGDATRNVAIASGLLAVLIAGGFLGLRWAFSGQQEPAASEG
jgi:hypothetical protein